VQVMYPEVNLCPRDSTKRYTMSKKILPVPTLMNANNTMRTPRLYLGTMTFNWSQTSSRVDELVAKDMVAKFCAFSATLDDDPTVRIDTARIYAGGQTEPCVAYALAANQDALSLSSLSFAVGTKAHPSQNGGLSPAGIKAQVTESLSAMPGVTHFSEYYLHQPDPEHSLLSSLQCLHEYYTQGLISAIGMSNYHASEMQRAFDLCRQHGLTPPTVYQGLYNPLHRAVEAELLPILRQNNCSFVAYNPLAAGLLAGKYTTPTSNDDTAVPKGRFRNNPNYLPRFYTSSNFAAVELIRRACENVGVSMVEATYRWMLRHSALGATDGVLLGASSVSQLEQNLAACRNAQPLPESVVAAFEEAWQITSQSGVFPYWRSYSADMPNRETLDPGASYEPSKKK
jgi:aflatoxin B1 aldehyde reductase